MCARTKHIPTYGNCPDYCDLGHAPAGRVGAAVLDGAADSNVAVQRDGAQMHDGGCREQHVQEDPHGAQHHGEGPSVI